MIHAPLVPASSLRALATGAIVAAFFLLGTVAIGWVVRLEAAQWLAASVMTAAMGGLLARLCTSEPTSPGASLGRTLGWSLVLGIANVPAAFLAAGACGLEALHPRMVPMAALATMIGAPYGLVLGFSFGLLASVPIAAVMRAWQRPSHEATDHAAAILGLWLAGVAVLAGALLDPRPEPLVALWDGDVEPGLAWIVQGLALLAAGLGIVLAAAAAHSSAARRRFVARVATGRMPGWGVAAAPLDRAALEPLPRLGATSDGCDALLVRCEHAGRGAYRGIAIERPMAWVPGGWLPLTGPRA